MEVGWWRGNLFERSLCCTSCKTSHVFLRACISALTAFTTSLKYTAYAAFPLEMSHSWTTRMSNWLKKSGLFFFFFLRCFLSVLAASSFALICLAPPKRVCLFFFTILRGMEEQHSPLGAGALCYEEKSQLKYLFCKSPTVTRWHLVAGTAIVKVCWIREGCKHRVGKGIRAVLAELEPTKWDESGIIMRLWGPDERWEEAPKS